MKREPRSAAGAAAGAAIGAAACSRSTSAGFAICTQVQAPSEDSPSPSSEPACGKQGDRLEDSPLNLSLMYIDGQFMAMFLRAAISVRSKLNGIRGYGHTSASSIR